LFHPKLLLFERRRSLALLLFDIRWLSFSFSNTRRSPGYNFDVPKLDVDVIE
jgi:hypothetical protein